MVFKHSFHVFIDNFSVIYKQLLYRLIILVVASAITVTSLYPFVHEMINSEAFTSLAENIRGFIVGLLKGQVDTLSGISERVRESYGQVMVLLKTRLTAIIWSVLLILFVYIVEKWFSGLGNYTTAVLVNDKMALRASSPFVGTLISHLKEAAVYNLIYVPLSIAYDLIIVAVLFLALHYMLFSEWFLVSVFLFALIIVLSLTLKMTFTTDWLPALIRGKLGQKKSIAYSFSRKGKGTLNVFSNYLVLILIIFALNVMAAMFTFGVGVLITVPSSYLIIICYEMVNYYDREEIKYFTDKNTIVKPDKERVITREQFFTGEGEE